MSYMFKFSGLLEFVCETKIIKNMEPLDKVMRVHTHN